ncbi:F-box family protein [Striga asiatica]|uniref:F-box family protein n=1 Tax=Striga asiatica TaxID=4170 RepID=A0A5A7Q7C8_STRAF|nr:F-box family protein [Striga asiatica]
MAPPMLIWLHLTQEKHTPIGSSHGRLAFSGDDQNPNDPFLFCPFSSTRIRLPRIHSQLDKIVLCGNPSHDPNFTALAIHNADVAFCRPDTSQTWARLDSDLPTIYDIICCDKTKTAFILGPGPAIEAWDMGWALPCKKSDILEDFSPEAVARAEERYPRQLYTTRWYLGRSELGELYVVVRYVGEFVRHDGEVVSEGDTLTDYAAEPLVCPYKTVGFEVFRYSGDCEGNNKWVVAGDLAGRAMFLGGNQTVMVEEKEAN